MKLPRDREPSAHIEKLPAPIGLKELCPTIYATAFQASRIRRNARWTMGTKLSTLIASRNAAWDLHVATMASLAARCPTAASWCPARRFEIHSSTQGKLSRWPWLVSRSGRRNKKIARRSRSWPSARTCNPKENQCGACPAFSKVRTRWFRVEVVRRACLLRQALLSSASVATPSTSTSCSELCRAPPSAPLEGQAVFALTDGPGATPNTPDHDKPEDNLARVAKRMHDRKLCAAEKASEHNSSEPDDGDRVLKRPATIKAGERDVAIACPVPDGPRRAWRFAQDHLCGGGVREESLARNARLTLQDNGRARGAPHGCLRLNFSRRGCRSTALGALRWERP